LCTHIFLPLNILLYLLLLLLLYYYYCLFYYYYDYYCCYYYDYYYHYYCIQVPSQPVSVRSKRPSQPIVLQYTSSDLSPRKTVTPQLNASQTAQSPSLFQKSIGASILLQDALIAQSQVDQGDRLISLPAQGAECSPSDTPSFVPQSVSPIFASSTASKPTLVDSPPCRSTPLPSHTNSGFSPTSTHNSDLARNLQVEIVSESFNYRSQTSVNRKQVVM
jgi:hypothetical protein